jgi:hypothetical protein
MKLKTLASIGCLGVILAACGGGGGGGDAGTAGGPGSVSPSVLASVDAFIAYVRGLAPDETSEPLTLPDVAAPTTETGDAA